jgi:hypothetical protein
MTRSPGLFTISARLIHEAGATSTRWSWQTAPPPMSASRSAPVALALAAPATRLGQKPLLVAVTPGRTASLTRTIARNSPRSL